MTTAYIGKSTSRVDGPAKVTGEARYAGEYGASELVFGHVVPSAAAKGRIRGIDADEALRLPGVLQVFTHENVPPAPAAEDSFQDDVAPPGTPFRPLQSDKILFSMQPVALVVAETPELARHAASLVRVDVDREPHVTELKAELSRAYKPKPREAIPPPPPPRGESEQAFAQSELQVDAEFFMPAEHHNPMEPFATTAVWEDGRLVVYDKTQGVQNVHGYLSGALGCSPDELVVRSRFVGGAFGSGLRPQYQVYLAALAARQLQRSVRVSLTRQQMFSFGHRPATWQRVRLGAAADGRLQAVLHEAVAETSRFEDYSESLVDWSGLLYHCPNVALSHKVAQLDVFTPIDMRAPGAVWGVYALECAMDELAEQAKLDPIELRLGNYAERDQNQDRPFSSKELKTCYGQAAERFGWERRNPQLRSMRKGDLLVGWGMAGGVWEAQQRPATARAVLSADGRLEVSSATEDIGTGTYTIMTQIAAETLGLPIEQVRFQLGDSSLGKAPVEGGSFTASSVGSAVRAACLELQEKLLGCAAAMEGSPLAGADLADMLFADGAMRLRNAPESSVSFAEAMQHANIDVIEATTPAKPDQSRQQYSCYAHSAVLAEVLVDEDFGTVRVNRVASAVAGGRIINPKTARSQIMGGIVWGIGMALEEESVLDHAFGRFINHDLAKYHIPVNADVNEIDVLFVEERDEIVNPLGAKGLGEIGIVGVAAAIANAVYHATGKRFRDLPLTPARLLS
jgi:xanthine dehydrogenase YagR molybdenum-binding subunit